VTGQTVSHYRVLEKLGEGGMGVVYKAEDLKLRRTVALKFLPSKESDKRERLIREAQAAASLNHPGICTIHEIDEQHGFIAMEFVDGLTLEDRIKARPLPLDEALDIAIQAAEALLVAHQAGMVHRDIKPANLMVTTGGQVKIMDFGLAQLEGRTRITRAGATPGTPAYMSPEQVLGETLDARTDIWSLAVTLYEAVTGRAPFRGETEPSVTYAIVHQDPAPPTALRSDVPLELDRLIHKALAKDRNDRYQRTDDLLVDLRALRTSPSTGRQTVAKRAGFPVRAILALTVVALVMAGIVFRLRQPAAPAGGTGIKTLAVLPLKSLTRNAEDASLELGMADTIITRVSQLGALTVRPTSAVRKYTAADVDTLRAAQELGVDAILEGTLQREGNRVRVTVNLLRTSDGGSIWAQKFDVQFSGIFDVQDQVSSQVAAKLQGELSAGQQAKLKKRTTSNPEAYAFYTKGVYLRTTRTAAQLDPNLRAIEEFRRAIALDPGFAMAHAQIALAAVEVAVFYGGHSDMVSVAREEADRAEQLDPTLAEPAVVRGVLLFSQYGDFRMEEGIRALRMAQKLDPNAGLNYLAYCYAHVGLLDMWPPLKERELEIDPSNLLGKETFAGYYYLNGQDEEGLAIEKRFLNRGPGIRYYSHKRMLKELRPLVMAAYANNPSRVGYHGGNPALLLALEGRHREAHEAIPGILAKTSRDIGYHHVTYDFARAWALAGNVSEAVKMLQATAETGMPAYPRFRNDSMLDLIRRDPQFIRFLDEQKSRWEVASREFR
jgi:TolB-like protein/predicted Ser/Thr protein kinase/tetratricopeptide (TPR) repeat protein